MQIRAYNAIMKGRKRKAKKMSTIYQYLSTDLTAHHAIDELPDAKSFGMHIHDLYEIYYFVSGEVNYLVEGHEYTLEPIH